MNKVAQSIILISNEQDCFLVKDEVARMSGPVKRRLLSREMRLLDNNNRGTGDFRMRFHMINSTVLNLIIEFCSHHQVDPMPIIERSFRRRLRLQHEADSDSEDEDDEPESPVTMNELVPKWYADFVDVDQQRLIELVNAAFYMEIEPLMDLTAAAVAIMFNGTNLREMRNLHETIEVSLPDSVRLRRNIFRRVSSFLAPGTILFTS